MTQPMSRIEDIRDRVRSGDTSALEIAESALAAAESTKDYGAFVHLDAEHVREQARRIDASRDERAASLPLMGVPIALKDNICVKGQPTTCASKILGDFKPFYDAEVTARLRAAGAVLFGRANMDEFAMGSSGENSSKGASRNPWDRERVPGGSSSGSAVAVAAGIVPASLGSDTGGSIRQPAAFCGLVGFKPTWGRVSRRGLVAFASSLDQIGPLTHGVADAALVYEAIAGFDDGDSTSDPRAIEPVRSLIDQGVAGLKVGLPDEYLTDELGAEVRAEVDRAARLLQQAGAEIVNVSLPHTRHAVDTYYVIASAEASSNLARFDGVRYGRRSEEAGSLRELYERSRTEGFGPEVRRRIMLGTYALSAGYYDAYYRKAQQVRSLFCRDFAEAFAKCDVLLAPTTPSPAFKLGERLADPLEMYLADIFTIPTNLAGLPGMSLPMGNSSTGLPIGVQLLAAPFAEETLFRFAGALEQARGALPLSPVARSLEDA